MSVAALRVACENDPGVTNTVRSAPFDAASHQNRARSLPSTLDRGSVVIPLAEVIWAASSALTVPASVQPTEVTEKTSIWGRLRGRKSR